MLGSTSTRSWGWTPSPFFNRVITFILHAPLLHHLISRQILLLAYTGHKSGKRYVIPVGYLREGHTVIILTKWFRAWWRNFIDAAPVELLIAGKTCHGTAKALTDEETTVPLLAESIRQFPNNAAFYGIRLAASNQPNMDDVRRVAPKVVAVQVTLVES